MILVWSVVSIELTHTKLCVLFLFLFRSLFNAHYRDQSAAVKLKLREEHKQLLQSSVGVMPTTGVTVTGDTIGSHCRSANCGLNNGAASTTAASTDSTTSSTSSSGSCALSGRCVTVIGVSPPCFNYRLDSIENWHNSIMLCWNAVQLSCFGFLREQINCAITPKSIQRTWNRKQSCYEHYISLTELLLSKRAKVRLVVVVVVVVLLWFP